MDRDFLRNAFLRASWQVTRLGMAGKTGFGLLVFSAVFFVAAVSPRNEESSALMGQAEAMNARLRKEPVPTAPTAPTVTATARNLKGDQGLQFFYDFFPYIDSSPFWIKEIVQIAMQHNVEINGSDYRMVREKGWKLARYEMAVPVRGKYPQIRAFIADALRAVPAMALVDVTIKREGVESELLEVGLKFNLYLSEGKR